MQLSLFTTSLLLSLAIASPIPKTSTKTKSAAASSAATGASSGSVLSSSTYNAISISGGTAGTAEAEANAIFSAIDRTKLASVSAADLKIIKNTHDVAEDAEVQAFNPAVAAASTGAATTIGNGKIKNKVLKLTAEVLGIQIKAAQGEDGSDLAAEQAKLANNIKLDKAAAGQASTAVPLDGTT